MALATKCPYCQTTFKVAQDQLKLRSGLVRCGTCKQVFNGIEHLVSPDAPAPASIPAPPSEASTPARPVFVPPPSIPPETIGRPQVDFVPLDEPPLTLPVVQQAQAPLSTDKPENSPQAKLPSDFTLQTAAVTQTMPAPAAAFREPAPQDEAAVVPPALTTAEEQQEPQPALTPHAVEVPQHDADKPVSPLSSVHLNGASEPEPEPETPSETEELSLAEAEAETESETEEPDTDADELDEPDFVIRSRKRQRIGRIVRIFMAIGSVLLLLTLALQGAFAFRNQLAAWFPQTKPMLAQLCTLAGCQVKLPAQIEMVTIESNELQALAADKHTFMLALLLRNHSPVTQAWPYIELTLNDANENALARRVLLPRDYLLPTQDASKGFPANSEQPVKLSFELPQLKASGYRVYLFYP